MAGSRWEEVEIQAVRLEVAVARRQGVEAVVGEGDGLGVLELRKDLRLEDVQAVDVVALGGDDRDAARLAREAKNFSSLLRSLSPTVMKAWYSSQRKMTSRQCRSGRLPSWGCGRVWRAASPA